MAAILLIVPGVCCDEKLSATYTRRPSGLILIPRGLAPTRIVETTVSVVVSITVTVPSRSLLT
jgi:hypothetical protein